MGQNKKKKQLYFLESSNSVEHLDITDKHSSAAVALQTNRVKNFLAVFPLAFNTLSILFPEVCDGFSAAETSNRNNHRVTCTISVALRALFRVCWVCVFPYGEHQPPGSNDRNQGIVFQARGCVQQAHDQ